jgi:hypothetical protein
MSLLQKSAGGVIFSFPLEWISRDAGIRYGISWS